MTELEEAAIKAEEEISISDLADEKTGKLWIAIKLYEKARDAEDYGTDVYHRCDTKLNELTLLASKFDSEEVLRVEVISNLSSNYSEQELAELLYEELSMDARREWYQGIISDL